MTTKDYAQIVLNMNSAQKTEQAIQKLRHGLKHETSWNNEHRKEVSTLIAFLESGKTDVNELGFYSL